MYGHVSLLEADIDVRLFPRDLIQAIVALNKKWSDTRRKPEVAPPPISKPAFIEWLRLPAQLR